MKKPDFCYSKAFWIVVPALIVIFSGMLGYLNEKIDANGSLLDQRSYPINILIPEINEKSEQNTKNILIICRGLNFDCLE